MPSQTFQDFYQSCFDTSFGATRDGLNVQALLNLEGDELAEAERLVLQAVETSVDPRPLCAAGYLKLQAAGAILKRRLKSSVDVGRVDNRVHIAWALHQIERYPESARIVVDVLTHTPKDNQWSRMMAVEALADFGEMPLAVIALLETLIDEDHFIAYLATNSLKRIFKLDAAVVSILNEIQLMQIGNRVSVNTVELQEARERVKTLVGVHSSG
ncbi:MAG: hypothetical protein HGB05_00090 [Chloroflexi bacterium]|nr:hypothetical protein [Chloroflexota bacterium]